MNAEELAAVVLDEAERNGITREELALRILGGPIDKRAQFWVHTCDWTPAEMDMALRAVSILGLRDRPRTEGEKLDALMARVDALNIDYTR